MLDVRAFAKKHKQNPFIRILLWLRLWLIKKLYQARAAFPNITGYDRNSRGFEKQEEIWENTLRQSSGFKQNLRWGNLGDPRNMSMKMRHVC